MNQVALATRQPDIQFEPKMLMSRPLRDTINSLRGTLQELADPDPRFQHLEKSPDYWHVFGNRIAASFSTSTEIGRPQFPDNNPTFDTHKNPDLWVACLQGQEIIALQENCILRAAIREMKQQFGNKLAARLDSLSANRESIVKGILQQTAELTGTPKHILTSEEAITRAMAITIVFSSIVSDITSKGFILFPYR